MSDERNTGDVAGDSGASADSDGTTKRVAGNVVPRYEAFEKIYQQLRSNGALGWGAETLDRRVEGWKEFLALLLKDEHFPRPGARLLEIGCGAGSVSELFVRAGYEMVGVDISQTAIKWAKQRFAYLGLSSDENILPSGSGASRADFYCGNAVRPSFLKSESFDAVIDGNLLHCIIGKDRVLVLSEVARVLKPRGCFWVSSLVGDPKRAEELERFDSKTRVLSQANAPSRCMLAVADLRNEIASAGFEILSETVRENPWWDHLHLLARKNA